MRIQFGILFAFVSLSARAQVIGNPYASRCQYSIFSDSFGRGVESAFSGQDLRSRTNDETCYQLGQELASAALSSEARCRSEFKRAYGEGLSASLLSSGSQCYNLGYSAGRAALGTGAREGNRALVGNSCVKAYNKGRADGKVGRTSTPGTNSQPELTCYELGHFEAGLF